MLLHADQRTDAWLDARLGKLTASLAAAALGLDCHKSRAAAWREIIGMNRQRQNGAMRWGTEHEPAARAAYEVHSGLLVQETGFWVHDAHEWLGASPDGLVGDEGLLECKVPGKLPVGVPVAHRIQCMTQLLVTGRQWCDYFVYVVGPEPLTFLERIDRRGLAGLLHRLQQFHERYLVTGIEPAKKRRKRR